MKFLKLWNKLFDRPDGLLRKDVLDYNSKQKNAHEIEQRSLSHEFDTEAFEGLTDFKINQADFDQMDQRFQNLKQKNTKKRHFKANLFLVLFTMSSIVLLFWMYNFVNEMAPVANDKPTEISNEFKKLESKTEVDSPSKKETIKETLKDRTNKHDMLSKEQIKTEEKETSNIVDLKVLEAIQTDLMPLKTTPIISNLKLNLKIANEIYIHDFKLIDYSKIRSGNVKQNMNEHLNGTSAKHANKLNDQTTEDDFIFDKDLAYIDVISTAMYHLKNGNYAYSMKELNLILSTFPDDRNANFYKAYILYNTENFQESLEYFSKAFDVKLANFYEESKWFSALSLIQLKRKKEGEKILLQIVIHNGFYAEQAKNLLNELK